MLKRFFAILISVILVLTVLPQLLLLSAKAVEKTTFRIHLAEGGEAG